MLSLEWARKFAEDWVDAWNAHDLERILEHYTDDFVFSSPLIRERGFAPDGVLHGKDAVRPYWTAGLEAQPPIRFEIRELFLGADCLTIRYQSIARTLVCETFFFGNDGKVVRSAAAYAA